MYDKEKRRKYYLEHKKEASEWHKKYHLEHREELLEAARKWHQAHREERRKSVNRNRKRRRLEALVHYGKGKLACVKCGFEDVRALTIDHINNDGAEHRKKISGRNLPDGRIGMWLRARDYPEGYQTLCMNCQFIKEAERREEAITGA